MEKFNKRPSRFKDQKKSQKSSQNSLPSVKEISKKNSQQNTIEIKFRRIGNLKKINAYKKMIQVQRRPFQSQIENNLGKWKRIGSLKKIPAIIYEDGIKKSRFIQNNNEVEKPRFNRFSQQEQLKSRKEQQKIQEKVQQNKKSQTLKHLRKPSQSSHVLEQKQSRHLDQRTNLRKQTDQFSVNCLLYLPQITHLISQPSQGQKENKREAKKGDTGTSGEHSFKMIQELDEGTNFRKDKNSIDKFFMKPNFEVRKGSHKVKKESQKENARFSMQVSAKVPNMDSPPLFSKIKHK